MTKHPKILLIAPHSTQHRKTAILIPIGLLSIAGYLRKCGYEVKVYNASFVPKGSSKDRMENVKKVLKDYSPDILGFGFPTDAFEPAISIAKLAKELNKNISVIVGGIHPTAMPEQTLKISYFDFLVNGEGEITTLELINAIISETGYRGVKGISYKKNGEIIKNEARPAMINLDEIPFDNRDLLIDVEKYPKQALGQIHTSRGCIYHCAYCSVHIVWKNNIRFRSVENVLGEIDYLYLKYRVRDFNFADDNFTSNTERLQTICHGIIKRKYKIGWRCCARSDISRNLNSQDLKLMYNAGCRTMCIGFESGAQSLLDGVNRNITVSDMEKTIKMVKDAGIELHADFIMGLPGENEATLAETGKLMKKLWDNYRPTMTVVLYKPYPGTPLWKHSRCDLQIRSHLLFPKFKELFDYAEKCNIKKLSGNLGYVSGRLLESITSPKVILLLFKKVIRSMNPAPISTSEYSSNLSIKAKQHSLENRSGVKNIRTSGASYRAGLYLAGKLIRDRFLTYYNELNRTQWLKKDELDNLHASKLQKLLSYALQNIPFYRNRFAGFNAEAMNPAPFDKTHCEKTPSKRVVTAQPDKRGGVNSISDIKNLPLLSKDELKEAGKDAVTLEKKKFIRKTTSGTTGPAFTFVVDRDFFSLEIARNLRIFDLTGMEIGEPWVMLVPLRDRKSFIFSKLINRLVLDAKLLTPARTPLCCPASNQSVRPATGERFQADEAIVRSFCNKIKKHKPKVLYSYPSTLIALATFIRNWGLKNIKAEKIITSGEVLTLPARKYIEEIFEGEVFDMYGTTEFPLIAEECKEHNGLHIFSDSYVVEILDKGEIVITDLDNYTMPFIRYKTGDAGILKNSQCGCGREFPLMEIVQGRVSDLIVAPNGEFFRASFFSLLLDKNREIKKFQIIQQEQGKLIIYIICDKLFSASRKDFIIKRFQEYVGNSLDISIEIVTDIGLPPKQFFQIYPVKTTL